MLNILSRLPFNLIFVISSDILSKKILNINKTSKPMSFYLSIVFIFSFILSLFNIIHYVILEIIIRIIVIFLEIYFLHNTNTYDILSTSITINCLNIFFTITILLIPNLFNNIITLRSNCLYWTLITLAVSLECYLLVLIKPINKLLTMNTTNSLILFMISICLYLLFYTNTNIKNRTSSFIIFIIITIIFTLFYAFEKRRYKKLLEKYDELLDYTNTFEIELERDTLARHEYKNQLAVIREMSRNKKVINYINDLLNNYKDDDSFNISGIDNLPKCGLRGVIYYKLCVMTNKKINFYLDITKDVKNKVSKISMKDMKALSYIIGISLDNAIDACLKDKNSNMAIEIYRSSNGIEFVISNTINDKINLDKLGMKGYSTKGLGHGNGLYIIKQILMMHRNITLDYNIINNYFIQRISIKSN